MRGRADRRARGCLADTGGRRLGRDDRQPELARERLDPVPA